MTLKVIGTGWGRTGTDSMRLALTILGFGPCHHMYEINASPALRDAWRALAKGAKPDWEMLFDGYNACVDWPSVAYWRELIALYPDAKVILTARPAESWWASYATTILLSIDSNPDKDSLVHTLIAAKVMQGRPGDHDHVVALYEAHVAEVMAEVPPERLLVHNLGDGWAPLCAHLGVNVPDEPYPNGNTTADIQARFGFKPAS
jgi:hypothetical protein